MRGPKSARRGRGKGKATARPRPKMTRRVSWSEDLEEVKHFEGGSSQEDEQDWVSVEREQGDASSVANDGNAASNHATGNSDGDGIQEDCEEPPEHQHEDGSSQENESLVVTPDDAAVAVADAAAAAAEEMLLGKGLLADNITDSQFRMSRMVLLDRGTAIKPLGISMIFFPLFLISFFLYYVCFPRTHFLRVTPPPLLSKSATACVQSFSSQLFFYTSSSSPRD